MLFDNLKNFRIILASRSPRRQTLLKGIGIDFEVIIHDELPETYPESLKEEQIALYIARMKAESFATVLPQDQLIITADTIVSIKGEILGKPADRDDAIRMLNMLSGSVHRVITGVCIRTALKTISFYDLSDVWFRTLSREEIEYYVDQYKPYDKAGAYGVQEWIGYIGIEKVEGSYFNVMGLPVHRVYDELKNF